jgi:UPF0755 protein
MQKRKIIVITTIFSVFIVAFVAALGPVRIYDGVKSRLFPEPWPALKTVRITVPEGWTVLQINQALQTSGVFRETDSLSHEFEGYLFPDTYEFFVPSTTEAVQEKFLNRFDEKTKNLLPSDLVKRNEVMTIASLIEKEVPNSDERKIVSGIIQKRLKNNWRLQMDSTICYLKQPNPCVPITDSDLEMKSLYNTYTNKGLPPGPIANPGLDAIEAALHPQSSKYWYYISDPVTKKTIFAVDNTEQNKNIYTYLKKK